MSGWYNGYSPTERDEKTKCRNLPGNLMPAAPPCDLCGDPDSPVRYHSEDYSQPWSWERGVAVFALCRACDSRLHKRFSSARAWIALLVCVERGYYGSEVSGVASRIRRGLPIADAPRAARDLPYLSYWKSRSMKAESLHAPWARPRP